MSFVTWFSSAKQYHRRRTHLAARRNRLVVSMRRACFEPLENRALLATFAEAGTLLNLDFNVANESVSIASAGSSYSLALTGGTWNGTDSANVTGNGTNLLTVTTAGLAAFDTLNLTDSAVGASVTFATSGANSYSDNFNVTLDSGPTSAVQFNGSSSFTLSNNINVTTARNIAFASSSSLKTVDGDITLSANQQLTATSGNFIGINVNTFGLIRASGTGTVTVLGKGGDSSAGNQHGVELNFSGEIIGGTSGLLTVQGIGGAGIGIANFGVSMFAYSTITSIGSNVIVSGSGGGTGSSSSNTGVQLNGPATITGGGSSNVTVVGLGGNLTGTGGSNHGVALSGLDPTIASSGGNVSVIGLAMLNYESAIQRFPPGMRFVNGGSPMDAVGTAWVSLLPYLEQSNAANSISSTIPWYLQNPASVQIVEAVYLCPSDTMESIHSYPFLGALGIPVGDKFATCSYGMNIGVNDALAFSPGFQPRPVNAFSGVFAFHSNTKIAHITDGTSNTFAVGEAASGFDMCQGINCTTPIGNNLAGEKKSVHGWLVGGANPSTLFAAGFRYSGGFGSTVEKINKSPVTDSFYDLAKINNNTPSWQGGPHRTPNFRSFHSSGANFSFCDGSVHYLNHTIDLIVFRALSTIQGGEIASIP